MAATQAEKQQNDVNSEKVPPDQHLNSRNTLLQNGTDKNNSVRGVVNAMAKASGTKNLGIDSMSQYQSGEQADPDIGANNDANLYPPTTEGDGHNYGFPFGAVEHGWPRQGFAGSKQPPGGGFTQQQRFLSGPTISQTTGPTPTLNQLLQSSNPIQRYNNYEQSYNQGWPPQKPYPGPGYRNQPSLSSTFSGGSAASPGYGESRTGGWAGPPVTGQHGPGSPGPPAATSQPSPQSQQQPSHSPGPGLPPSPQHQPPPPQHQGFPSRPAQPTTPNAHTPDAADLSGGNSNDSSGGPAPGTPNSQGMRPTPSPTGSTGSRSMSPAVGQQNIPMPPRPSSSQSDGGSTRMSHSPMATQSNYPPAHMHGYKVGTGHPASGMVPLAGQQVPMYSTPPNQQYPQGNYPARPQYPNQGYGPPVSQPPPPSNNNMPPGQYPNRSVANHTMSNSQFTPYQSSWSTPSSASPGNHLPGSKGPPQQAPGSASPRPHYLKQHLQHKMGFGNTTPSIPPSPSPPQNYHMGPPSSGHHISGMGPPLSMGPPNMVPPSNTAGGGPLPPASSPLMANSHQHDGPMPPPSSTPNSHHSLGSEMLDNGITTTATGGLGTHVTSASVGSVTSVVTTGPDGTPIDEGSQQSTLSNASAASGEDPQCTTPKQRKNDMAGGGHYSHPTTPQSTVPSPGAASMNSIHEEYELSSPSWPKTPASPVFNSHVPPPDTYRSKKTDSLSKLYDMDDSPDRRAWLDKLLSFMEERRSPITTCPTISKNPLDLFRLYVYVKERGGFMEVTKNKTWKDIAGMLGIGASSSAAYTLRKHYTKNLLAYECQFDRGGIDPQPIINQVEASSKKKGAKAASVPSPGSSNSQDSFSAPGSGGASLDGYGGYGYPGSNADYNAPPQRPSSQPNTGAGGTNHLGNTAPGGPSPGGGNADNVNVSNPFDDVSPSPPPRSGTNSQFPASGHPAYPAGTPPRPQGQAYGVQGGYTQYPGPGPGGPPPDQYSPYSATGNYPPATRPVYPPYSSEGGERYNPPSQTVSSTPSLTNNNQGSPSSGQDPYNRYAIGGAPAGGFTPRPAYGGAPNATGPPTSQPPATPYAGQEYYRPPDQNYPNQQGAPGNTANYPNKNMPPPPRRHPDFTKDQQQSFSYGQQRPQLYGWPNNNNQYRGQYVGSGAPGGPPQAAGQQWNQGGRPSGQWDRYPPGSQGGYHQQPQQGQQQWSPMPTPGVGQSSPLRPPMGPRPGKPFNIIPPGAKTGNQVPPATSSYPQAQLPKREITFPPDSVEATLPVLYRRKRMCRADLGPVDAWRIIMCLRSGLLSETCYALDVLNVLLFDDTSVPYFSLHQWPGLLDLLLEHLCKSLSDMFDEKQAEDKLDKTEVDLGGVNDPIEDCNKTEILTNTPNFSYQTRKGNIVKVLEKNDDIFITDHRKDWDVFGDATNANILNEVPSDPWYTQAKYILPTFQAEFGNIPFHTKLETVRNDKPDDESVRTEPHRTRESSPVPCINSDKRKRTKTISDVISRIKKDSPQVHDDVLALQNKGNVKTDVVQMEKCEEKTSTEVVCDGNLGIRDPATTLKRRRISDYEDEAYTRDEASLVLLTETQDTIGKRCVCISNILRSLTFVPGNEAEFVKNCTFLGLVGKLLLLHHEHPVRTQKQRNYDREEDADFADSCSSLQGESEWWWDFLVQIRENVLVSTANISGLIDLSIFDEEITRPVLDGLLHWAICPSAHGQDPFQSAGPSSLLSPQRLALEALCKLCVTNNNVDLVIATPPFSRLETLCAVLTKHLCRSEDQVMREFSVNLLHYLAAADSRMARVVALQKLCVSLLVGFIEQAEQSALGVANQHGIGALRENPDSMGTSLDMLRRTASTLVHLSRHPDNKALLLQQENRLLSLVMSQILDQQVALLLSRVLFQISRSS